MPDNSSAVLARVLKTISEVFAPKYRNLQPCAPIVDNIKTTLFENLHFENKDTGDRSIFFVVKSRETKSNKDVLVKNVVQQLKKLDALESTPRIKVYVVTFDDVSTTIRQHFDETLKHLLVIFCNMKSFTLEQPKHVLAPKVVKVYTGREAIRHLQEQHHAEPSSLAELKFNTSVDAVWYTDPIDTNIVLETQCASDNGLIVKHWRLTQ